VRIGAPLEQQGLIAELADPRYTPVVGLLRYGYERLIGAEEGPAEPRGLRRLFKAMSATRRAK
jgi:cell division ATPase FtsA